MNKLIQRIDSSWLGKQSAVIESNKALRIWIGALGIVLAPLTWFLAKLFGDISLLPSISKYYHTNAQDFFVGVLFFVGIFQISYRGHQVIDNLYTWLTGILALSIAAFPCTPILNATGMTAINSSDKIGIFALSANVSDKVHISVAILFFVLISVYVLFFFRKTHKDRPPSKQKQRKNLIFSICGYGMLLIIALLLIFLLIKGRDFFQYPGRLFFPEFGMLLLFGIAWMVKANIIPGLIDPVKS